MKAQQFDFMDPVSINGFMSGFSIAYDSDGIHEDTVMGLEPLVKKPTVAVTLTGRPSLKLKSSKKQRKA